MEKLIKAFQIFLKYGNPEYPTHCEHDVMYICNIDTSKVTEEDRKELLELGFFYDEDLEQFMSYRYGSA
jgi:hypothetical protein